MLDVKNIEKAFSETRKDYRYPPMILVIDRNYETPFYMDFGTVHINDDLLVDFIEAKSIMRHEIGHTHFAPVSIKRHKKFIDIIQKELGSKADQWLCHEISNYFSDFVVDKAIIEEFKDDLKHRLEVMLPTVKTLNKGKYPDHAFWWILMEYYNKVVNEEILAVEDQKQREAGDKCYEIICSEKPMEEKLKEVARLLNQQEFMKDYQSIQDFKEFLEKLSKYLKTNTKRVVTKESMRDKNEAKKELEDLIDDSPENRALVGGLAKALGIELEPFDYYKGLARKKIQFKIKSQPKQSGKIIRGGLETWMLEDESEDLDIEESVLDSGLLIPEQTTLKWEKKFGTDEIAQVLPSMLLTIDTSGSMSSEKAIVSCFSFIELCRTYKTQFAIILFSDTAYYNCDFSTDYDKKEREIFNSYQSGGTALLPASNAIIKILSNKEGSLVIFVSDLEAWDRNRAIDELRKIQKKHSIIFMTIDSDTKVQGFKQYFIKDLKELDRLVIENANNYLGV